MAGIGGAAVNVAADAISVGIRPDTYFNQYLINGDARNMGVNGQATPVSFIAGPPAGKNLLEARLILYLEGRTEFASLGFASLGALPGGVRISAAGVEIANWRDNIDIITDMYDLSATGLTNGGFTRVGRWTQTKGTTGEPLRIMEGEEIEALIRDDLRGILFRIKVQGKLVGI